MLVGLWPKLRWNLEDFLLLGGEEGRGVHGWGESEREKESWKLGMLKDRSVCLDVLCEKEVRV
jgi:hypothetical protein